jgi:uncharacterized iron-regulated protein
MSLLLLSAGCASAGRGVEDEGAWTAVDAGGREVTLDEMAERLAHADVVFLGENHDSDVGHALQLELFARLVELRGGAVLSLEMFERDVQLALDRYRWGRSDEAAFLEASRPWGNYAEHYRPAVELARAHGLPVIASNVPRPLAGRVAREGLGPVLGAEWMPREVDASPGAYRDRFEDAMGGHGAMPADAMERYFAAQCVKDDAMAESIAEALAREPGALVVHWCGRFHSDHGLGTVERLARRRPELDLVVVTMRTGTRNPRKVPAAELEAADYTWLVAP